MASFPGNSFVLISTPDLGIPPYIQDYLSAAGCPFTEIDNLADAMPLLDVLYMTRIQRERFASPEEYERQKGVYILDGRKMKQAKRDLDRPGTLCRGWTRSPWRWTTTHGQNTLSRPNTAFTRGMR